MEPKEELAKRKKQEDKISTSTQEKTNQQSKGKRNQSQRNDHHQKGNNKTKQNREENGASKNESTTPKKKHHSNKKLPEMNFEPYLAKEECSQKLKRGELIKGTLRINPRNFVDAFISATSSSERDIYIEGVAARNRSLPGDIVAVQLNPKEQWKTNRPGEPGEKSQSDAVTKTGKVVFILEEKHPRVACGFLKPYRGNQFGFALLSPNDNRLPRLMIPLTECPDDFKTQFSNYEKTLFIAQIVKWEKNKAFAGGKIMRSLGEAGHIEPETESILLCNDIDSSPFSENVLRCLPDGKKWKITSEELSKRRDMRKECVFTIDPATARDLDDALSCKKIADGLYEVGVHIADVTYFIDQNSALDDVASQRATSVYLAQKVVPMLPNVLCEQLCSLNPGVERLAYSVFWNMKSDGTIMSESFGRTVISSCVKLSYDHAQRMIEADNVTNLKANDFPPIKGDFPLNVIVNTVKTLFGMSKFLRQKRFDSGALRLDQPKLSFTLDSQTGMPNGCAVYQYKDSNRMIEEFMLLANMAVGRKIYKHHPDRAILRNHAPPQEIMMEEVADTCKKFGIPFDISNSSSISASLKSILTIENSGWNRETLFTALTLLCTKPFQNAKYFCTGTIESESAYRHYALNVPIYTHFTSPIRRYPDVMVHRLLTASLDKSFVVEADVDQLQAQSDNCNDKKWAAKKASEQSSLLFFAVYLLECGPLMEKGVVVNVLDKAVDVLCTRVGNVVRAYMDKLPLLKYQFTATDGKPKMTLYWFPEDLESGAKSDNLNEEIAKLTEQFEKKWQAKKEQSDEIPENALQQELSLFSDVNILLKVERDLPTKILGILAHPKNENTPSLEF